MNPVLIIVPILLLQGCANAAKEEQPVAAQSAAQEVRSAWEKATKPLVITVENDIPGLDKLGVWATLRDATPEEAQAFAGATFKRKDAEFVSDNPNAVTADTMPEVAVCWPPCVAQNVSLTQPFNEHLYGKGLTTALQSSMALLQIVTESNDLHDVLEGLKVYGDGLAVAGTYQPYKGQWSELLIGGYLEATDADYLMGNGREHNIYCVSTNSACPVTIFAKVNGRELSVKTELPPMTAGSMVRLNLRKDGSTLKITNSWVATKRPLTVEKVCPVDTVKCGHFLRRDGYVVAQRDSLCVAMVIETDSKHGKAVALADCDGIYSFGQSSGRYFATIDGRRTEGKINPTRHDNVAEDARIVYEPKTVFAKGSALYEKDGAMLTGALLRGFTSPSDEATLATKPMLMEVQRHPAAYVPSVAEWAQLYYFYNPLKGDYSWIESLPQPSGEYLTSSESSASTIYLFDFDNGVVTGSSSRQYTKAKLRLFYLF